LPVVARKFNIADREAINRKVGYLSTSRRAKVSEDKYRTWIRTRAVIGIGIIMSKTANATI
jgi:hypothetical protein